MKKKIVRLSIKYTLANLSSNQSPVNVRFDEFAHMGTITPKNEEEIPTMSTQDINSEVFSQMKELMHKEIKMI